MHLNPLVFFLLPMKTDIVFLEREIKNRKQQFGVEVYELMEQLEVNTGMPTSEKESKIRQSFDRARKDIAVIQAKIECKKEEVQVLDQQKNNKQPQVAYATAPNHPPILMESHPGDL